MKFFMIGFLSTFALLISADKILSKGWKLMTGLLTIITTSAIEYFLSGSVAAISLYCGVKTPKNNGIKND